MIADHSGKNETPVLVVGGGSIGCRHRDIVAGLGVAVRTVSRRPGHGDFTSIAAAFAREPFAAVVIATETSRHKRDLTDILNAGSGCAVLVEKPLFADFDEHSGILPAAPVHVGYNLRFHPVVEAVRNWLAENRDPVVAARFYVGQRLSDWRPGRKMDSIYSANVSGGGGVLRDLSHELDLAQWFFGMPQRITAIGGRYGVETIDADDAWSILMECPDAPQVSVSLNCLDPLPGRTISITTAKSNIHADLIRGTVETPEGMQTLQVEKNQSYRDMWAAILGGDDESGRLCGYREGLSVMAVISACETAAKNNTWVEMAGVA